LIGINDLQIVIFITPCDSAKVTSDVANARQCTARHKN